MSKEELILFPAMKGAMRRLEHDDHGQALRKLGSLTSGFTVPSGAPLYAGAWKFADDLMQHIHLENNVLFPRFAKRPTD